MKKIVLIVMVLVASIASASAQQVMTWKGNDFTVTTRDGGQWFIVNENTIYSNCIEDMDAHMTTEMTFDCVSGSSKLRIELRKNPVSQKWRIHSATIN